MKNDETQINYQNIDYELTIKRGLNICEQNKTALQNRYQLLHSSAVRSASMYSDEYSIMAEPVIPGSRTTLIPVARAIYSIV